jgi:hypothetical protein
VRLRHGGDDAREIVERGGELRQRGTVAPGQHEPVGRRPEGRRDDAASGFDRPESVVGIEARLVAQRPGEAEDQVVPRLVGE